MPLGIATERLSAGLLVAAAVCCGGAAGDAAVVRFAYTCSDPGLAAVGAGGYVDIFVTPEGGDYLNHDMIAIPHVGRILDPMLYGDGSFGGLDDRIDTWADTPFSSLGLGFPVFVYTRYDPGGVRRYPDPPPRPGGTPDHLNWTVFDTNTGDNAANAPAGGYHLGRVLYEAGGRGTVEVLVFDEGNVQTGGQRFITTYGVPEPAAWVLLITGCLVLSSLSRRSRFCRSRSEGAHDA